MVELEIRTFVFDRPASQKMSLPETSSALKMVAKRYRPVDCDVTGSLSQGDMASKDDFTLLFAHGVGAHKEQWEPTIQTIFNLARARGYTGKLCIREAWSFDWLSHGDAALVNKKALEERGGVAVSIYEWARAISTFIVSEHMLGHNIVLAGHSAGAGAMMLTVKDFAPWSLPIRAIILVEPTIMTREQFEAIIDDRMASMNQSIKATLKRRRSWPTRAEAFAWFSTRFPGTNMESRVLQAFVNHGLHETSNGIELKCDRVIEAASYPDVEGHFEAATLIPRFSGILPIHLLWGSKPSYLPDDIRASMSDGSYGYTVSSTRVVMGAGHMVVQEKPDEVAECICEMLSGSARVTLKQRPLQARL